jgi:ABC-type transport system involved in multi-copper enzyme maturation permease subunit
MLWALLRRSFARHRALIAGLAGLLAGFQFLLVLVAVNLQRQGLFSSMAAMVPPFVQEALGGMMVATFSGMVSLGFFHPVVMLSLTCGTLYLASEPAGEVEHGLVDLVVARPVPRHLIVTRSALVFIGVSAGIVVLMLIANHAAVRLFAPAGTAVLPYRRLLLVAVNLLSVVWCFSAASLAMAGHVRRRGAAAGTVALVAVLLYLLQFAAAAWPTLRPVARVSPFHYYEAMPTLLGVSSPVRNIAGLLIATGVLVAIAQLMYSQRDL